MDRTLATLGLLASGAVFACADPGTVATDLVVRDSAGVRIWEYPQFPPPTFPRWTTSPEPTLSMGEVEGEEPYLFAGIRGAVPLPGGGVAVGDGQSAEIRFFDGGGRHVRTTGGEGGGPGEFTRLWSLFPFRGDSIVGVNFPPRVLSIFDGQGSWGRTLECSAGASGLGGGFVEGALANGTVLVRAMEQFQTEAPEVGYQRTSVFYLLCSPDGEEGPVLREVPGREIEIRMEEAGLRSYPLELGRQAASVIVGDDVLVGATDGLELWRYGSDGSLKGVLRVGFPAVPVTQEVRDGWAGQLLSGTDDPEEARALRQSLRDRLWAGALPAFSQLRGDAAGNLWVRPFVPGYEEDPGAWWVFGPDGVLLAQATLPPELRVTALGSDFVLGIMLDEWEVERVVRFRLEKEE